MARGKGEEGVSGMNVEEIEVAEAFFIENKRKKEVYIYIHTPFICERNTKDVCVCVCV